MAGPGLLRFRNEPPGAKYANRTAGGNIVSGRQGGVSVRFRIQGGDVLMRKLAQLQKAVSDQALTQAVLAGAEVLADEWRRVAPVDEGNLRRSITATASPGRRNGATAIVYPDIVPGVPANEQPVLYAARLEFGSLRQTRRMLRRGDPGGAGRFRRPRPSLRPAFDNSHQQMADAVADELRHIIRQVAP